MEGTVLKYNRQTGWGFIRPDSPDSPDFFVCYKFVEAASKFERYLKPGQRVQFDAVDPDTKPQAHHVRLISPITIARQVGSKAVQ
jgi:cold shock CspA family protein